MKNPTSLSILSENKKGAIDFVPLIVYYFLFGIPRSMDASKKCGLTNPERG